MFNYKIREAVIVILSFIPIGILVAMFSGLQSHEVEFINTFIAKTNLANAEFAYKAASNGSYVIYDTYKVKNIDDLHALVGNMKQNSEKIDKLYKLSSEKQKYWNMGLIAITILANLFLAFLSLRWLKSNKA